MEEINKDDYNSKVGLRIKAARSIYNEGIRLSLEQFSHLLDISTEKLINYEKGRSGLPINVQLELYRRGINPIYLLAGEGDIFADNEIGQTIRRNIIQKKINYVEIVAEITNSPLFINTNQKVTLPEIPVITAAAGIIKKKK